MARPYHLKSFIRQAPNALLECYFAQRQIPMDVPWSNLNEKDTAPVLRAIESLPDKTRQRTELDFGNILAMADEGGIRILIDEARHPHHGLELAETLGAMRSHIERVFWVFLEYPSVFRVAIRFQHADRLTRWRRRNHLPAADADTSPEARQNLGMALADYYRMTEGRGGRC